MLPDRSALQPVGGHIYALSALEAENAKATPLIEKAS
jgi:hypothetical protein